MSTTTKPVNQKAWFLILPVLLCVAFSAILPLMVVAGAAGDDLAHAAYRGAVMSATVSAFRFG